MVNNEHANIAVYRVRTYLEPQNECMGMHLFHVFKVTNYPEFQFPHSGFP